MYKTCNLVMLPSNKKATKGELFIDSNNQLDISCMNIGCRFNAQHLYIISDDEIKENSLVLLPDKTVHRMNASDMISYLDSGSNATKCIIATTQAFMNLPQPSKEFIEAYIKAYNECKQITTVEVEYWCGETNCNCETRQQDCFRAKQNQVIKINPDNTINIKLIKDSRNRSEVVELLIKAMIYANKYPAYELDEEDVSNWIEENL